MTSRKIAAFVICACLLMIGGVLAQEPEPTPTDTPTLVPTDTATNTDTPSPVPTDTATDTSTVTSTDTSLPTDTPTSTATATAPETTPEVTDAPPLGEALTNTPTPTPNVLCSPGYQYLGGDGLGDLNYVVNDSFGTTIYDPSGDYLQNVSTEEDTAAFVTVDFALPVGWTSVTISYTIQFTRGYLPGSTFYRLYRRGSSTAAWEGAETAPGGFEGTQTYSWTLTPNSISTIPSYLGLRVQSNNGDPDTGYARINWIEVCGVAGTATPTPTLTPTNTPTLTPTLDPNEQAYYNRFKGMIFWIIFNETAQNTMDERFDIVEAAVQNADPNDPNRIVNMPNLASYSGELRENLRLPYLFSRLVLENIPDYSGASGNLQQAFSDGFNFGKNWGGSINNTDYDIWTAYFGCPDRDGDDETVLSTYSVAYSAPATQALDWLSDYAICAATRSDTYETAYQFFSYHIDRAIRDHILDVPNPVAGASQVRHANTCFWFHADGGCAYVREVPSLCVSSLRCRTLGRYVEGNFLDPISETVFNTWRDNYINGFPEDSPYRTATSTQYLFSTQNIITNTIVEQITYTTQIRMRYFLSLGLYDLNGDANEPRYLLMGVGTDENYGTEAIAETFLRHWNRLNRDRDPVGSPETYRPNFCVVAMIHAVQGTGIFQQWTTFTFQSTSFVDRNVDIWYCEAVQ